LRGAQRWKHRGREVIEKEVGRQIYPDGSYVQHSMNYHRVMLQVLAWAIRLGQVNDDPLPASVRGAFANAAGFLVPLVNKTSGLAPNYGANDGALVLPLSDCPYVDFRPVANACTLLSGGRKAYPPGPWDEESVWLNGLAALETPSAEGEETPQQLSGNGSGYRILRVSESWAMLRAGQYADRPSHADQLHVDLWWGGENVLCDPGTYSYHAQKPFEHGFASTRFHNTVTVDGADQMTRASRFLWVDWAQACVRYARLTDHFSGVEAEHDGYRKRGVLHRRMLANCGKGTWIIVDDLLGDNEHDWQVQWLVTDCSWQFVSPQAVAFQTISGEMQMTFLASSPGASVDIARCGKQVGAGSKKDVDPARGWISRYYGAMCPALSVQMSGRSHLPLRLVTAIQLGTALNVDFNSSSDRIQIGSVEIELASVGSTPILQACA